ncbi:MAG: hydroxymethylglutaryl-CoA lyase [Shinella sp.]|nr:hydroxymethylglutaryl-CoA lyase [Shinella sp.]
MAEFVEIVEMSPRDGLQNEKRIIPASGKIALIDKLSSCGFRRIEAASFVSPKWVPQLADGAEVMAGIARRPGTRYTALVPNLKGYEAARAARVDEVAIFVSASEGFSRANVNCSIAESLDRLQPVAQAARSDGIPLRGYVNCVVVCPYDGPTPPKAAADVAEKLLVLGCREVALGETFGRGRPEEVAAMLKAVCAVVPARQLAGHYHDTDGHALANIRTSLDHGLRVFDASVGGLGGCPYAPGARGNVDTCAVAAMLEELGFSSGLDRQMLDEAARLGRELVSTSQREEAR